MQPASEPPVGLWKLLPVRRVPGETPGAQLALSRRRPRRGASVDRPTTPRAAGVVHCPTLPEMLRPSGSDDRMPKPTSTTSMTPTIISATKVRRTASGADHPQPDLPSQSGQRPTSSKGAAQNPHRRSSSATANTLPEVPRAEQQLCRRATHPNTIAVRVGKVNLLGPRLVDHDD